MKKKLFMLMIAFLMFIPLTIVKADELDDVISNLNGRIGGHEYIGGTAPGYEWAGTDIAVEKVDTNKIKVTATTDIGGAYDATWPEGFIDDLDTSATSFIIYEYSNSTISFKGDFGFEGNEDATINYRTAEKDEWANVLAVQNNYITRELLHASYEVKTGKSESEITAYLEEKGLEQIGGRLSFAPYNADGIKITVGEDEWVTEYSINLNEINIPGTTNNNNNNNNNNTNTNTTTDDKTEYNFIVGDYSISFEDHKDGDYTFRVDLFSTFHNPLSEQPVTSTNQEEKERFEKILNETKELTKENGEYIELYNISVFSPVSGYKTDGPFMLKIKITDKIKKYDTYELVNLICTETECEKGDVVKLKVEGDYLVGELPHLSQYVLVGKNTPNPGTGITKYTIPGIALLLGTFGIYALYKKKSEI